MKKFRKMLAFLLVVTLSLSALAGCQSQQEEEVTKYSMYYLALSKTKLETVPYEPSAEDTETMIQEIYQKLPGTDGLLISKSWPEADLDFVFVKEEALAGHLQEAVRIVRAARSQLGIGPEKRFSVVIRPAEGFEASDLFEDQKALMASFMGASEVIVDRTASADVSQAYPSGAQGYEVFCFVKEAIDVDAEIRKLEAEIAKAEKSLEGTMKKLNNPQFVSNAKSEAIEKERSKKAEFEEKISQSREHIALLRKLS